MKKYEIEIKEMDKAKYLVTIRSNEFFGRKEYREQSKEDILNLINILIEGENFIIKKKRKEAENEKS